MLLETISQRFRKARTTNATDNGFPARFMSATMPSGSGNSVAQATASAVFLLRNEFGMCVQNGVIVMPYGTGSNNQTGSIRLYAWDLAVDPTDPGNTDTSEWVAMLLVELAFVVSSSLPGLTGRTIGTGELFADTITLTYGNANVSVDIVSPAADVPAHAVVDIKGAALLEVTTTTGGSLTSVNALLKMV